MNFSPKQLLDATFLRFVLVGIANTLFGTAVMFIAYNVIGLSYWVSSASNYVFGSILSYFLNKHFTFRSTDSSPKSVLRFVINISICYLLAYGMAQPLVRWIFSGAATNIQDNVSMLVGMGLFVILNYLGQRLFVFRTDKEEE